MLKHIICEKSGKTMQKILKKLVSQKVFLLFLKFRMRVKEMIASPIIKGVSLTGSELAGRKISRNCGARLKKCVLELGRSDAHRL